MSKSITPATAGTEKTRTRTPKQLTAMEIIRQFSGLELADKLKVKTFIEGNIKGEQQRLQEQLKLITGECASADAHR